MIEGKEKRSFMSFNSKDFKGFTFRSGPVKSTTKQNSSFWWNDNGVWFDHLMMRPKKLHFTKDSDLKQMWLDTIGVDNVAMVFDDRNQVVDMWRSNGLTTFQVADGDF